MENQPVSNKVYALLIVRGFIRTIFTPVIIFFIAGTFNYWQGWVLTGYLLFLAVLLTFIFNNRRELVLERVKPGAGVKVWDRVILIIFGIIMLGLLIVAVLDSARYHWSGELPVFVYIASYLGLTAAMSLVLWAMLANNYFATYVRIQADRGHKVCTSGPYQYVRHPGYIGVVLSVPCFALILGSYWALIPAGVILLLFILRTALEDKTLQKELDGYQEYTKKVKYRLVPGLW